MDLFKWRKRKNFERLKKAGKIKIEPFDTNRLKSLGLELLAFRDCLMESERRLTTTEHVAILEIEYVLGTIDLLLSENTEYGYLEKLAHTDELEVGEE